MKCFLPLILGNWIFTLACFTRKIQGAKYRWWLTFRVRRELGSKSSFTTTSLLVAVETNLLVTDLGAAGMDVKLTSRWLCYWSFAASALFDLLQLIDWKSSQLHPPSLSEAGWSWLQLPILTQSLGSSRHRIQNFSFWCTPFMTYPFPLFTQDTYY